MSLFARVQGLHEFQNLCALQRFLWRMRPIPVYTLPCNFRQIELNVETYCWRHSSMNTTKNTRLAASVFHNYMTIYQLSSAGATHCLLDTPCRSCPCIPR